MLLCRVVPTSPSTRFYMYSTLKRTGARAAGLRSPLAPSKPRQLRVQFRMPMSRHLRALAETLHAVRRRHLASIIVTALLLLVPRTGSAQIQACAGMASGDEIHPQVSILMTDGSEFCGWGTQQGINNHTMSMEYTFWANQGMTVMTGRFDIPLVEMLSGAGPQTWIMTNIQIDGPGSDNMPLYIDSPIPQSESKDVVSGGKAYAGLMPQSGAVGLLACSEATFAIQMAAPMRRIV